MEVNSFQTPNQLVDEYLAELNGNELKILLVIIRKTKGWNKEFDGISISQFQKFTGIKDERTVRKAIKKLINLGLIEKVDNAGKFSLYCLTPPATNDGGQKMVGVATNAGTPPATNAGTPPATNAPHKYTLPKDTNTKKNINKKEPVKEENKTKTSTKKTNVKNSQLVEEKKEAIQKLMDLIRDFYKEKNLSLTGNKVFKYQKSLFDLLKNYSLEDIEEVIKFGMKDKFYSKLITIPSSLFNNFESMKLAYEEQEEPHFKSALDFYEINLPKGWIL